jgi:hypothetical protein
MHLVSYRSFHGQILFFFLSLAPLEAVFSQHLLADTAFVASAEKSAIEKYSRSLGVGSHLLNGIQYKEYNPHSDDIGNPFFVSDDWVEGSVFYDGQRYDQVAILYDLVREKVVIEHPYSGTKLELITEKIGYFSLPDHWFVRLNADTIKDSPITTGFYDLLYNGPTRFYAKRQKIQRDHIVGRDILVEFSVNDRLYLYKNGVYYPVKGKASVFSVLADRKTDIRKFLRKNKINIRRNPEKAISRVVSFYDESGK